MIFKISVLCTITHHYGNYSNRHFATNLVLFRKKKRKNFDKKKNLVLFKFVRATN